jgi:hypothetical protein
MKAEEFQAGLHTLGILHETTLPHAPYHYVAAVVMCCPASSPAHSMVIKQYNST